MMTSIYDYIYEQLKYLDDNVVRYHIILLDKEFCTLIMYGFLNTEKIQSIEISRQLYDLLDIKSVSLYDVACLHLNI